MSTSPLSTTAAADAVLPSSHPFAAHLRRAAEVAAAAPHRGWTADDGPLPSLYVSHGSPMLFEMADWMTELHDWARRLPKPKAVLVVSAHWESAPLSITSTAPTELVYDFGGFDPMYYGLRYDTPDAGALARQVVGGGGHARGQALEDRHQGRTVGLACREPAQHRPSLPAGRCRGRPERAGVRGR